MITKLRKILGIDTIEERIVEYNSICENIDLKNQELDVLVSNHNETTNIYKSQIDELNKVIEKGSDDSLNIQHRVSVRYNNYFNDYLDKIAIIKSELDNLSEKKNKLLNDDNLRKAVDEYNLLDSFQKIRLAYHNGQVKRDILEKAIENVEDYFEKGSNKKTKYADCIVTNTEGQFLFLKRDANNDFQPNVYGLPGGHVDPLESFKDAAIRELEEETGLKAENAYYAFTYEDDNCIIKYYECKVELNNPFSSYDIMLHGNEHSNYKWMSYQEYKDEDLIMNLKDVLEEIYGDEIVKQQNEEIRKAFEVATKAYKDNQIDDDTYLKVLYNYEEFEKSVSKYGESKHTEKVKVTKNGKTFYREQQVGGGKKNEEKHKTFTDEELAEHARSASENDLQRHIKENGDENMRVAAHNELKRRGIEESYEEDKEDEKIKKEQEKQDKKERNKWLEEYSKYKLSRLPIDVPKKDVQINTSGDVDSHWIMKWVDKKTGKELRAYTQGFMKKNAEYKWERIQNIKSEDIENIKNIAIKALKSKDKKEQQIGAVLLIISNTGLRVGSRDGFSETQNRGVTTLNSENIKIDGNKISLEFRGKSYKNNTAEFENEDLAKYLTELMKINKKEDFIFNKIDDSYVRDYFHENVNKDWKIKDMRTFVATDLARKILFDDKTPPPPLPEKKTGIKKLIQDKLTNVYKTVSEQLNNSPSMAKNSYIHPKVTEEWLNYIGVKELM